MHLVSGFDEEKNRLVRNGGSMAEDTKNMVGSMLTAIERKVEEESGNRQRDVGDAKDALEQKLISLLDKMKGDER